MEFIDRNFTYIVGRQGAFIGATGLLYSTERYMGADFGAIDGVTVKGRAGATELKLVAGRQWNTRYNDDKLLALQASYSPAPNWTLGGVLARYDCENENTYDHTNHWDVNIGYTLGKADFVAEYADSSADKRDKAYVIGVNYNFDERNSAYIHYSRIEWFGDMEWWGEFVYNAKGIQIGYDYKLDKDTTLKLLYKNMKDIDPFEGNEAPYDYEVFRTGIVYKF